MNNHLKFWLFCFPARALLLLLVASLEFSWFGPELINWMKFVVGAGLIIGGGLMLNTYRVKGVGGTGFNGGVRYWNSAVHGILYVLAGTHLMFLDASPFRYTGTVSLGVSLAYGVTNVTRNYVFSNKKM